MNIGVLETLPTATKASGIPARLISSSGETITFLYNPESKSYGRSASYSPAAAGGSSLPQQNYTGGTGRTLSLPNLLLDSFCAGRSLRNLIESLEKLLIPTAPGLAPPTVSFVWGSESFSPAVVSDVVWEETAWLSGEPAIARVSLNLIQLPPADSPTTLPTVPTGETALTDRQRATAVTEAGKWLRANLSRLKPDVKSAVSSNRFKYLTTEAGQVSITDATGKLIGVVGVWDGYTFTAGSEVIK